jgi:UDP-glucose 4-epimerase
MILLTGGSGAVGRSIAREFIRNGQELILITRDKKNVSKLEHSLLHVEQGSVIDLDFLSGIFKKYAIHAVVHCAWDGVSGSFRNSAGQIQNFIASKNLLELAGLCQVKTFIGLGSQAEYGIYNRRISEEFVPRPENLYGIYKLSAGLLGKVLARHYGFRFAWLRLFAAYGPDDNPQFIIPYTIKSLLENRRPDLSSCEQLWDYLFLPDISLIIRQIVNSSEGFNDIFNLSSGHAIKLKEIVCCIKDILQTDIEPNFGATPQKNDLFFLEGDNTKLTETFKPLPFTDINKGLALTVEWFKTQSILT